MPLKGYKQTDEHKKNISENTKGRKQTKEHIKKVIDARRGYRHSDETKRKLSEINKGRELSEATRQKMSISRKAEKHYNWKGGVTSINRLLRGRIEYKLWRKAVFERDNYICIWCGGKSGKDNFVYLQADHIMPFAHYPELRFSIDNGRTLCMECHKKTETYKGRANNI